MNLEEKQTEYAKIFIEIDEINERQQIYHLNGSMKVFNPESQITEKDVDYIFFNSRRMKLVNSKMNFEEKYQSVNFFGKFSFSPDYVRYPFDVQILEMKFNKKTEVVDFTVNLISSVLKEWDFIESKVNDETIEMSICRRPMGVVLNLLIPLFIICSFSFTSYYFYCYELSSRLQVLMTVLLTITALKFVHSQSVNQSLDLTYVDKYFILSYIIVIIMTIETCSCSVFYFNDINVGQFLGFIWVISNFIFYKVTSKREAIKKSLYLRSKSVSYTK